VGILDEDVTRVREATDLVALAAEHIALRRVGNRHLGLCPFHAEKTPSFSINPALGVYYCFGCQARGDAITFVREVEHLDFVEAVERLAARSGITVRYDDEGANRERRQRNRLSEVVSAAAEIYHRRLLEAPDAGVARGYLRSRGFDGDVVRRFQLGWAPDTFDTVSLELQQRKFTRDELVDAGVSFVNRANKLQDVFRSRLLFPIFDARGDAVAFGGRTLGNDQPKYKNSSEGPLYHKSRVLYGLNWAREEIVRADQVVVCEGYTDVIAFALAGVGRAVATCGTALADDHFRMLKNFTRTIVLAYDADAAGQKAAERFYEWESRYEVTLLVAALPAGRDPADVWRGDPSALVAAVAGARPFLEFRLDRLLAASDTSAIEGKARAAELAMAMIGEHPSEIVRGEYVSRTAVRLGLDAARLVEIASRARRASNTPAVNGGPTSAPRAAHDAGELAGLALAIHAPDKITGRLSSAVFVDPVVRAAFDAVVVSESFGAAVAKVDDDARELLQRLAVEEPAWGDDPDTYAGEVVFTLTEAAANRLLRRLVGDDDGRSSNEVKRLLSDLAAARRDGQWATAIRAADQLVAWVSGPSEV